ncbi:MAG: helix-turn-helix domain-containing protein [Clostridia bacterium]|nr:helix-turn-helix domain-containing protein [Clostridia bacterium]
MKKIYISENITDLRKKRGITQKQLASALHISPQAVSKWETNTSQPDTQTLPLIADYFGVRIDDLFYGKESGNSRREEMHRMAPDGEEPQPGAIAVCEQPAHISDKNGLSLLSGKGYGAILTRSFFENINEETADFAISFLPILSEKKNLLVCMAIISMSDISFSELQEKLGFDTHTLRRVLDLLIEANLVVEQRSKHRALGFTYAINSSYHTCLCILLATVEMQRYSCQGITCHVEYGDYPIQL